MAYWSILIADLTLIYAIYMVKGWPKIFAGFYIMTAGVILVNYIAIKIFFKRKGAESGEIS